MSLANWWENAILKHLLGKELLPMSSPAVIEVALFPGDPGEDGEGANEPAVETGYAPVVTGPLDWTVAGNSASNAAALEFPEAVGAGYGTITHFGLYIDDSFVGGGALTAPKTIAAGDVARFAAGELTLTMD